MPGPQNLRTPPRVYRSLNQKFGPFKLDAAASKHNALCKNYYTVADNGLKQRWIDPTFCNPPFGKTTLWIKKAGFEWRVCKIRSIVLVPVGGSQKWWHNLDPDYVRVYYPDKRILFSLPGRENIDESTKRDTIIITFGYKDLCINRPDFIGYRIHLI